MQNLSRSRNQRPKSEDDDRQERLSTNHATIVISGIAGSRSALAADAAATSGAHVGRELRASSCRAGSSRRGESRRRPRRRCAASAGKSGSVDGDRSIRRADEVEVGGELVRLGRPAPVELAVAVVRLERSADMSARAGGRSSGSRTRCRSSKREAPVAFVVGAPGRDDSRSTSSRPWPECPASRGSGRAGRAGRSPRAASAAGFSTTCHDPTWSALAGDPADWAGVAPFALGPLEAARSRCLAMATCSVCRVDLEVPVLRRRREQLPALRRRASRPARDRASRA